MRGRPKGLAAASDDLRFAAAVAVDGMVLRHSKHRGRSSLALARALAAKARGRDEKGYRAAFVALVDDTIAVD